MTAPFFPAIEKIRYEGPDTRNPLAFRHYDADRLVLGKRMEDHLRLAVCYWHSFCWPGSDIFGGGTFDRPWLLPGDPVQRAEEKLAVAFEFFAKLGVPYFTFHDRDIAPELETPRETRRVLDRIYARVEEKMAETGAKLLWGTANLFGNPRYMAGAATNPDPEVFAFAAAQVRHVLEATHRLGGENYVLWGGREGYDTLLNTDLRRESDQLARFLTMVVEHKHKLGFRGALLIEPKPMEPTKHQYDFDCATVHAFLQKYGLAGEIKVNIEVNHATLAGHTFEHEVTYALANGIFGSIDINRGDPQNGWDTDQFPNNVADLVVAVYQILKAGGLASGGFNFDAKLRRQSIDPADMFHAHIGGIDTMARALLSAARLMEDGKLQALIDERYHAWDSPLGKQIRSGDLTLAALADLADEKNVSPQPRSGRQEMFENLVNAYV